MNNTNENSLFYSLLLHLPSRTCSRTVPIFPILLLFLPLTLCRSLSNVLLLHLLSPLLQFHPDPLSLSLSAAGQLSQSAHLSLQLPYTVLGLGRSANFLDHLFVGIPRPPGVKVQTYILTHAHTQGAYGGREVGIMSRQAPGGEEHADGLVYFYLLALTVSETRQNIVSNVLYIFLINS